MPGDFATNVREFCAVLRSENGFAIGQGEIRDALRAVEVAGLGDSRRVRTALRLVCCASPAQIEVFEDVYDRFFLRPVRTTQPKESETRTLEAQSDGVMGDDVEHEKRSANETDDDSLEESSKRRERRPVDTDPVDAQAWMTMLARFSPVSAPAEAPVIESAGSDALLLAAGRLIASVRAGRSRRWERQARGARLDVRATLRSSLRTSGDPLALRRLGHPTRNPRFVLLLDGSRSMAEFRNPVLAFAYAMVQRSRRTGVWLFSTGLRDVTRDLRNVHTSSERTLRALGDAWGGGTRIGGSMFEFVRAQGSRWIDGDTTVMVFSDGLDVGEIDEMRRALRDMRARGADIIWINPHAGMAGFAPTAKAMRAALPFVNALVGIREVRDFADLPERIWRARRSKTLI